MCGVARVNVYLPDELAAEAKRAGLNLSAVTRGAVRRTLAERSTDAWLATVAMVTTERRLRAVPSVDVVVI